MDGRFTGHGIKKDGEFKKACINGDIDTISKCVLFEQISWNNGMEYAALGGHQYLIDTFINRGANSWNEGMKNAIEGGHVDIVKFFIEKGANDFDSGLYCSAYYNNKELIDFFLEKNANINEGLYGALENNPKLIKFFLDRGADNWNWGLLEASTYGRLNNLKYYLKKGATNIDEALQKAILNNQKIIALYLLDNGASLGNNNIAIWILEREKEKDIGRIIVENNIGLGGHSRRILDKYF